MGVRAPVKQICISSSIRALAQAVSDKNKAAIGPLHDALLDAGLTDLAEHFTDTSAWHPKGCWVIDAVLGKRA
jgi:hypothetical protein